MITGAELIEALPIIISLIVIEGLLSVDNALAIAAMASHLPGKQKYLALRLGIIGAYVFRGVVLLLAAWIIQNEWVKWFGAAYLVYLMCSHLSQAEEGDGDLANAKKKPGLFMTIMQIELMDLSLSVDNVIAAVALAPKGPDGQEKMWVVYTGVFIGILALRLAAGVCIRLLQKYPVLGQTAFLLVGYVGFILVFELLTHIHIQAWQKFIGIVIITAIALYYDRSPVLQKILRPVILVSLPLMKAFAGVLDWVFWPLRKLHEIISRMFRKSVPVEESAEVK